MMRVRPRVIADVCSGEGEEPHLELSRNLADIGPRMMPMRTAGRASPRNHRLLILTDMMP